MSITRRSTVALASITVIAALAFAPPVLSQSAHVLVPADKVQWGPVPPVFPPGAQMAVLEGNPAEKGPITLRLKFPANYAIAPHWHSMAERVTVLSGSFHVGMGDALNRDASVTLEAGGFVSLPAKMHHYAWTATPTIVQVTLEGPFDIYYVNATDNPQKPLTGR